ncbi:MAG: chemotaxis protein CheW [Gemmatimonadales bacterium]
MADHLSMSLLLFRLGDLNCAVPVRSVREIVPLGLAARIPGASADVEGLLNVRGRLVTVVDGRRALGRTEQPGIEPSILLVESNGRSIGLLVDEVNDLVTVPADSLDDGADLPGVDGGLVRAVGRWEGEVFVLLDTEAMLAPVFGR